MKRRDFLLRTMPSVLLPTLINGFSIRALAASPLMQVADGPDTDHVLVLVQLNGGNDGLNMVIPLEFYDAYHAARSNIAIPEDCILKLNGFDKTARPSSSNDQMTSRPTPTKEYWS